MGSPRPEDKTVQSLDVPLAPPPDPSYAIYDVIAEAADLDGHHVLRRGYCNAATKEGFGWDQGQTYDVPGGGQKGVITMYPLPGGSGVVEEEGIWTLTLLWVNNYAPVD